MKHFILFIFLTMSVCSFGQTFSQADSLTIDGGTEKAYYYGPAGSRFSQLTKRNFFVDPTGKTGYVWGINTTGNGYALYNRIWTTPSAGISQAGNYKINTGQSLISTDDKGVLTYDHSTQTMSIAAPRWTLSGTHLWSPNTWSIGLGVTSTTALTRFDMGQDFKAQKLALVRLGNFVMGMGTGTGTMRIFTSDGNANGIEWGQIASSNGTSFTRQMQLNNSSQLIVGGTATPSDAADKVYAVGNVKATQFLRPGSFSFSQAAGLSPSNGDIIYVSSTGGSFTTIGFWGYVNSAWAYLSADGTGTDDQTASEVSVSATPSNYTAGSADVEAHLAGIDAQLGTISSYDAGDIDIADISSNYVSTTVEGALQELGFEAFNPANAQTQAITKKSNIIIINDVNGSTQTQTITNTATTNGTRLFIKSDAATSVTFTSGSFIPLGSATSSTTFVISGVGEAEFIFYGGTWWQTS